MSYIRSIEVPIGQEFNLGEYAEFIGGYINDENDTIHLDIIDGHSWVVPWKVAALREGDEVPHGAKFIGSSYEDYYQDLVHIFAVRV